MKKIIKILTLCMVLLVGCAFTLPAITGTLESYAASKVKISKAKVNVIKGKAITLKLNGTKKKAKWTSSKKSVATVSSKGRVSAKKAGNATITAKIGKKKYRCKVIVKNPTTKLSKTSLKLSPKGTYKLVATSNGASKKTSWKSSKSTIASVNSSGTVTAKAVGTATITATMNGVSKSCKVTVSAPVGSRYNPADAKKGVTVKTIDGTMYIKVEATYRNEDAANKLKSDGNWYYKDPQRPDDIDDTDVYNTNIANNNLILLHFTVSATEGYSSDKRLYGYDFLSLDDIYNISTSNNLDNITLFNPDNSFFWYVPPHINRYDHHAWWRAGITKGSKRHPYIAIWTPKGLSGFTAPIYHTYSPDRYWVKYTF